MMPRRHIRLIQSIGSTLKTVVQKQVPQRTIRLHLDDAKTPQNSEGRPLMNADGE